MLQLLVLWMTAQNDTLEKGLAQPLLLTSEENQQNEEDEQEYDGSEEAPEESRRPANSIGSAYRLLTPSVKVYIHLTASYFISGLAFSVSFMIYH